MTEIKIKMCGMMRECDVKYACKLGADYIGFILSQGFKRSLSEEKFLQLYKNKYSNVKAVGVFVDDPIELIAEKYAQFLDLIQLHGKEDEAYIARLRELTKKLIIKAFKVSSENDIALANSSGADYVLLDSGTGSGKFFDHTLISGIDRPFFLAGGLTPENAAEIARRYKPYALDVSSGIETNGLKDKNKMAALIAAVRKER